MGHLWDSDFQNLVPDEDPNQTVAGVGKVLSEWEGVEIGLCRIFSIFRNDPDGEAMKEYGRPRIFRDRFLALSSAADSFFVSYPDQGLEGTLHELSNEIIALSDRRNEVAHGIVMPINAFSFAPKIIREMKPRTNYWALLPAYYQIRQHRSDGLPEFIYGSSALKEMAHSISGIYSRLSAYRSQINARIARTKSLAIERKV